MSLYYDERKNRVQLIENYRRKMQELVNKVDSAHDDYDQENDREVLDVEEEAADEIDELKEDVEDNFPNFSLWLRSISQCLRNFL